jgi:hypothetical protein
MVNESVIGSLSKVLLAYYASEARENSNLDLINRVSKVLTNMGGIFDKRQLIPGETREILTLKQSFINQGKKINLIQGQEHRLYFLIDRKRANFAFGD